MTAKVRLGASAHRVAGKPARKRHWWRWILAGVLVLTVLIVAVAVVLIKLQPAAPPLALPTSIARPPVGPVDGTWEVSAGSVAGFRVRESALGMSNDVTGRTTDVSGTVVISGSRVTRAALRVDLSAIKVNGKTQPQLASSLSTRAHPEATFTLSGPVTLGPALGSGAVITTTSTGQLTLRGISHEVTVTTSARRDGTVLQAAGSIPISFTRWGIKGPPGYGLFGSLADHGTAEFLLTLHRVAAAPDTAAPPGSG
jgi:polyisoprenoid-binding protein YceI